MQCEANHMFMMKLTKLARLKMNIEVEKFLAWTKRKFQANIAFVNQDWWRKCAHFFSSLSFFFLQDQPANKRVCGVEFLESVQSINIR